MLRIMYFGWCWCLVVVAVKVPNAQAWTSVVHKKDLTSTRFIIPNHLRPKQKSVLLPESSTRCRFKPSSTLSSPSSLEQTAADPARVDSSIATKNNNVETIPRTMEQALQTFFWGSSHGPQIVVIMLTVLCITRGCWVGSPVGITDIFAASSAMIYWFFQEHFLHRHVLHSKHFRWYGTTIHEEHHQRPYFHISIDKAPLMVAWLSIVTGLCVWLCPLPTIGLSMSIGYGMAGLWYEWCHYLAHTRVKFRNQSPLSKYFRAVQIHHARHHRIDDSAWLAFSIPSIDRLFGTHPEIQQQRKNANRNNSQTA